MNFKEQMRKDFESVFLNIDEFAEIFDVIRNGIRSHEITGIFAKKSLLQVKLDDDVMPGDVLRSRDTLQEVTVQSISKTSSSLNVYCR
ncbi:hypothetical protein Ga0466249_002777 [Sporomusaceae bacterium BoRhaA]|uniref:hypothetical protein n=1 Tax=Pelorhabdus rhamnosifermentans TaxID=2772457 RepID=UPI001C0622F7|nr:hypothetical protein [Pelorhabdus rhamnosifermentans]MBU2701658.1 hypothetical protein [Pelorhabdus rhamnosifermentans]